VPGWKCTLHDDFAMCHLASLLSLVSWLQPAMSRATRLRFSPLFLSSHTGETFRLPSEAEWEFACRAGTPTRFYWGDDLNNEVGDEYAWWGHSIQPGAQVVGQKLPNAWGVSDMSGNVAECCNDWYASYPSGSVTNPTGPTSGTGRVLRGGSWGTIGGCRSAARDFTSTGSTRTYTIGFRVAR
jgi:formylglycine-generating enzyme required for sulfatase activity